MTLVVKKIGDLFRLVDEKTGDIALNTKTGKPLDGGEDKCGPTQEDADRKARQASHVNENVQKKGETLNE